MRTEVTFGTIKVTAKNAIIVAKEGSAIFACNRYEDEDAAELVLLDIEDAVNEMKGIMKENNIADCLSVKRMIKERMR